jgi:hypothetical protein
MKASPTPGKFPTLILCGLLILPTGLSELHAQHSVTLRDGSRREGNITGVTNNNVRIQTQIEGRGQIETSVALADITAASMDAPAALEQAEDLRLQGNAAGARAQVEPLVTSYLGLPVPWVQRAILLLVDTQLEGGDTDVAEQTLVKFRQAYPDSADATGLMQAKIAVARNNFAGAKPLLAPILTEAEQTNLADTGQSVRFGQAFYLMGQIREQEGDLPGALQDFLRASTIFYADSATAARAQERANLLVEEKNVVVP